MTTWRKYVLIQIPGWVLAVSLLTGLHYWIGLPLWVASILFLSYVLKDFILYPFLRSAYESNVKTGTEQLVGVSGRATESLDPQGYVEVRGELWQARADPSDRPIPRGTRIRVRAARDLTLTVAVDEVKPETAATASPSRRDG